MENINNTEFKELISENSGAVIIDCRTEIEWDEGRIKNAILLDLFESQLFMQKVEGFDKNKIYSDRGIWVLTISLNPPSIFVTFSTPFALKIDAAIKER